jgi:hypothetical protein
VRPRYASIALVLALGLGACGHQSSHPTEVGPNNDGTYVYSGPVTYQLEVSRELNQYDTEDSHYLAGVPSTDSSLKPDELWYGVFLWAKNQTGTPQTTASQFDIVDTEGNKYYPVTLSRSANPYAWSSQTLAPSGTEPAADTNASTGPTQGRLLLFKLNTSVYSNRPLKLEIFGSGQPQPSGISLDL